MSNKNAIDKFEKDFLLDIPKNTEVIFEEDEVAFDGSSLFSVLQIDDDDVIMITNQVKNAGWSALPFNQKFEVELTKRIDSLSQSGSEFINFNCKNGYFVIRQNNSLKKWAKNDSIANIKIAVLDLDKAQIYYCKWTY